MTSLSRAFRASAAAASQATADAFPGLDLVLAPASFEEAAKMLALACDHRARVLIRGGGTHQGFGGRVEPDVVLSTERLDRVVEWQPDDLTLVVEAGVTTGKAEQLLATAGQTAVLPELTTSTIGGVVAAGISSWQRLRYGPTRDRMLEVVLITGDGRQVRGGGRVVKNVTGYDLPRLTTGSLGGLGLIAQVCLKLWTVPEATATVTLEDPERAMLAYRPLSIIEIPSTTLVFLGGHPADIEAEATSLGGDVEEGLRWPAPLEEPVLLSLRVPPRLMAEARGRLPAGWTYQIEPGVGQVSLGTVPEEILEAARLRAWAERNGGSLVVAQAPDTFYDDFDPWGSPPATIEMQRKLVARFDPLRVVNPGRLPGAL